MTERLIINPNILIWRREGFNATQEDVARWAGTTVERVEQWESGEIGPSVNQLEKVAKKLLTSMTAFFAEELPPENQKPLVSFRKLFGAEHREPSFALLRQVERAIARRDDLWALLMAEEHRPKPFDLSITMDNVARAVADIREWAQVGVTEFTPAPSTKDHVLNDWIDAIESAGVAVFHVETVEIDELRGLAIKDDRMPIILLNPKDSLRARTFTLLHELAHLGLGQNDWSEEALSASVVTSASGKAESFCNQVAAELMMPEAIVRDFVRQELNGAGASPIQSETDIKRVANAFCASYSMATIRLQTLSLVDSNIAQQFLNALQASELSKSSSSEGGDFYRSNLQRVGRAYARVILDAYQSGLISYATAGQKLNARKRDGVERMRGVL